MNVIFYSGFSLNSNKIIMTIDWLNSYTHFRSNITHLTESLLITTRSFNELLSIDSIQMTCFEVPEKFRTDGASVPRIARPIAWVSPRDKEIFLPAIWHDFIYSRQKLKLYEYDYKTRTKWKLIKEIDIFISQKMQEMWGSFRQCSFVYLGLFIGGWIQWNKSKKLLDNK